MTKGQLQFCNTTSCQSLSTINTFTNHMIDQPKIRSPQTLQCITRTDDKHKYVGDTLTIYTSIGNMCVKGTQAGY